MMKRRFISGRFRFPLFWRYFTLLAVVVAIFIFALYTSIQNSSGIMQSAYSDHVQDAFEQHCDLLSENMEQINSLIISMDSMEYYNSIAYAKLPLEPRHYYFTKEVYQFFHIQSSLLTHISNTFLYFTKNGTCITSEHIYYNDESQFRKDYAYEVPDSVSRWVEKVSPDGKLHVFPAQSVTVNRTVTDSFLTVMKQPRNSGQIFSFLLSTDSLLDYVGLDSFPENTSFRLLSESGEILYAHNISSDASGGYMEFSAPVTGLSSTAVLGIPETYFQDLTKEAQASSYQILLIAVLAGIGICILFSYFGVQPIRFLMREHALSRESNRSEMAAIDSYLRSAKQHNETLRRLLLSGVLSRSFYAMPISEKERVTLTRDFPVFETPLLLTVIRDLRPDSEAKQQPLFDVLQTQLPDEVFCEHMSLTELCIIAPPEVLSCEKIQRLLLEINEELFDNPRFVAGSSAPFIGLSQVSTAVRQAQLCIPEDPSRIFGLFTDDTFPPSSDLSRTLCDTKPLQQELANWNQKGVTQILQNIVQDAAQDKFSHPEEVFYNILFLLREAAQSNNMSLGSYESTAWCKQLSAVANLNSLKEVAAHLFSQRTQMQTSEVQHISRRLIRYVGEHYANPDLSLSFLAQEFCVSESFVHKTLISETGTNFSKLLLDVRMKEAANLLLTTDKSNTEISEACGYLAISSFYRNFKKYYNVTPSEFKEATTVTTAHFSDK